MPGMLWGEDGRLWLVFYEKSTVGAWENYGGEKHDDWCVEKVRDSLDEQRSMIDKDLWLR
jgi:hypothetical protein